MSPQKAKETMQKGLGKIFNAACARAEMWTKNEIPVKARRNLVLAEEVRRKSDAYNKPRAA
jgi:phage terminase Nu1 subunit (DNA packaging protein)